MRGSTPGTSLKEIHAFLRNCLDCDIEEIVRVEHGHWSQAFTFNCHYGRLVVRFSVTDENFRKDLSVADHGARTFPVPRIIDIGHAFDGFYAISERVVGVHMDELGGERMRWVLPDLLANLDAIHGLDISATSGFGEWRPDGNASHVSWRAYLLDVGVDRPANETHGWRRRMLAVGFPTTLFDETLGLLETLVDGCREYRCLIHGDILNYNVLVSGSRVAGLLDWGWAKYGDFLYDLARLCFWAPDYPDWRSIDFRAVALRHYRRSGVDISDFDERLRCYQVHVGLLAQVHGAFHGQWSRMGTIARRTRELAS